MPISDWLTSLVVPRYNGMLASYWSVVFERQTKKLIWKYRIWNWIETRKKIKTEKNSKFSNPIFEPEPTQKILYKGVHSDFNLILGEENGNTKWHSHTVKSCSLWKSTKCKYNVKISVIILFTGQHWINHKFLWSYSCWCWKMRQN